METEILKRSRRCSKYFCDFISEKFGISIESRQDRGFVQCLIFRTLPSTDRRCRLIAVPDAGERLMPLHDSRLGHGNECQPGSKRVYDAAPCSPLVILVPSRSKRSLPKAVVTQSELSVFSSAIPVFKSSRRNCSQEAEPFAASAVPKGLAT